MDILTTTTIINKNELIFWSNNRSMYVKEVDEFNTPISFTEDDSEALRVPNTLNFKNSDKYTTLIQNKEIEPMNRIEETTHNTYIEKL